METTWTIAQMERNTSDDFVVEAQKNPVTSAGMPWLHKNKELNYELHWSGTWTGASRTFCLHCCGW